MAVWKLEPTDHGGRAGVADCHTVILTAHTELYQKSCPVTVPSQTPYEPWCPVVDFRFQFQIDTSVHR